MTSSTWNSEAGGPLVGVGVDVERVARFVRAGNPGNPLPMVFTDAETAHADGQRDPARALCAAFCVKEALFKALGKAIDPRECEVLARPGQAVPRVILGPSMRADLGGMTMEVRLFEDGGDLVAAVMLRGEGA